MKTYTFVSDVNKNGAKSKPLHMTAEELDEEIADSYDKVLGDGQAPNYHEQFTGPCIPYIDLDVVGESNRDFYIKKVRAAVSSVFGDCRLILADRSGFSAKHQQQKGIYSSLHTKCWLFLLSSGMWCIHDESIQRLRH